MTLYEAFLRPYLEHRLWCQGTLWLHELQQECMLKKAIGMSSRMESLSREETTKVLHLPDKTKAEKGYAYSL